MTENYKVPLKYKEGTYKVDEIVNFSGKVIDIEYIGCDIFRYIVPKYDREVRIYGVNENHVFMATYDNVGVIKHIELKREKRTELVYINFKDNEHAKENIWQYSCFWADRISEKILERKEKISRLFIEHFYDGQAVDFAAKTGTPEDMQNIFAQYGDGSDAIDNSGDYPFENRIEADNDTLRIMLSCTDNGFDCELYGFSVYVMTERIKENILEKLDKTDDFKFLDAEYD